MLSSALLVSLAVLGQTPTSTRLARVFSPNEKLAYKVQSVLKAETRGRGLQTWMPEQVRLSYGFTLGVEQVKPEGIAVVRYQRPAITQTDDDMLGNGPKTKVDKIGLDALLTISPLNKVLDTKDLTKKPAKWSLPALYTAPRQTDPITPFISEIYRLALFTGGLDSAIDLAPPFPLREVSVGDTWKSTVSFQPQKLKGANGKQAVQRLDYVYTYKGPMDSLGKKVQRVVADLDLSTDLAEFFNQTVEADADETGLDKIPLTLKAHIEFDLDPKTFRTISARATSQGGFQIMLTAYPGEAVAEQKLDGTTVMSLVGVGSTKG